MSERSEDDSKQTTPEREPQSTERTPGGLEVPVPTREEFFGNLLKAAKSDVREAAREFREELDNEPDEDANEKSS